MNTILMTAPATIYTSFRIVQQDEHYSIIEVPKGTQLQEVIRVVDIFETFEQAREEIISLSLTASIRSLIHLNPIEIEEEERMAA